MILGIPLGVGFAFVLVYCPWYYSLFYSFGVILLKFVVDFIFG